MTDNKNTEKQRQIFGELIAKCWSDRSFKESFKKDPKKYLVESGIEIKNNMNFKVVEQTNTINYMILPNEMDFQNMQKTMLEIFNKATQKEFRLPENGEIRIVQNTENINYICIPMKYESDELSDVDMKHVAGGTGQSSQPLYSQQPVAVGGIAIIVSVI